MFLLEAEGFTDLLRSQAHWQFELLVGFIEMVVFDVVVGALAWPAVKRHFHRDIEDASMRSSGSWPYHVTDKHEGHHHD